MHEKQVIELLRSQGMCGHVFEEECPDGTRRRVACICPIGHGDGQHDGAWTIERRQADGLSHCLGFAFGDFVYDVMEPLCLPIVMPGSIWRLRSGHLSSPECASVRVDRIIPGGTGLPAMVVYTPDQTPAVVAGEESTDHHHRYHRFVQGVVEESADYQPRFVQRYEPATGPHRKIFTSDSAQDAAWLADLLSRQGGQ